MLRPDGLPNVYMEWIALVQEDVVLCVVLLSNGWKVKLSK